MLSKSAFKVAKPVELFGRFFNDELYMEAVNRTGSAGIVDAEVGNLPVRFAFENDPEHAVIRLAGVKTAPANVKTVAKTPAYTLPATVKLSRGTTAHLSAGNGTLKVELSVADPSVKAAEGDSLWGGSAVEVFLDPSPFRELSRDAVKPYQYAFAALPSKGNGMTALAIRNPATKASRKVEKTADGYRMEILIPLDELPPAAVYGFDIEISRPGRKKERIAGCEPRKFVPLPSALSPLPSSGCLSSERGFFASLFRRSGCVVLRDPRRRFLPVRSGVRTDGQRHENRGSQAGWQTCGRRTAF